jgi:hypothetical protein
VLVSRACTATLEATRAAARLAQVKGREIGNTGTPRIQGVIPDQTNGWMKILRARVPQTVFKKNRQKLFSAGSCRFAVLIRPNQ